MNERRVSQKSAKSLSDCKSSIGTEEWWESYQNPKSGRTLGADPGMELCKSLTNVIRLLFGVVINSREIWILMAQGKDDLEIHRSLRDSGFYP